MDPAENASLGSHDLPTHAFNPRGVAVLASLCVFLKWPRLIFLVEMSLPFKAK